MTASEGYDDSGSVRCRWSCPFCGRSRVIHDDAEPDDSAILGRARLALRGHITSFDGDGHGPRYDLPEDLDLDLLDHHISLL